METRIKEEKEKLEKQFRLLKEQAENRFQSAGAGDLLSPRVKQLVKESEERRTKIEEFLTRGFERLAGSPAYPRKRSALNLRNPPRPEKGLTSSASVAFTGWNN